MAESAGTSSTYRLSLINGGGLRYQWEHHDATNNGVDAWLYLPTGTYGKLLLNESVPLGSAYTWNRTAYYAQLFSEMAASRRPDLQVYLYDTWPHLNNIDPRKWSMPTWSEEVDGDIAIWESIAEELDANLNLENPTVIIPAGLAVRHLRQAVEAGTVPGITTFESLFTDDIHFNPTGTYYIGLVFYACLFETSPIGLTGDIPAFWSGNYVSVPPALRDRLQELAWETVSQYPRSGVREAPRDDDQDGVANAQDGCPLSDTRPTVQLWGCDSGVVNQDLGDGCFLADELATCAAQTPTPSVYQACFESRLTALLNDGHIQADQADALRLCAARYGLPQPTQDAYTVDAWSSLDIAAPGVLGNDQGLAAFGALQVVGHEPPAYGSLAVQADGRFLYTPDPQHLGPITWSYTCANSVGSQQVQVTITVTPGIPPDGDEDGTPDSEDTCPESPLSETVAINGCDSGVPNLRLGAGCTLADTVSACAEGFPPKWLFLQNLGQRLTSLVNAGKLSQTQAQAVLACGQSYDLPTATPDVYTIAPNTLLVVPPPGLLANDSDAEGDPLEAHLERAPTSGTFSLQRDGSFRFQPAPDMMGDVVFVYRCWDGNGYRTAEAVIHVTDGRPPDNDRDGVPDAEDRCPFTQAAPTIQINGCETGVPNVSMGQGCFLSDSLANCAVGAPPRWAFVTCATQLVNSQVQAGKLTSAQGQAILACAQSYDLPNPEPDSYVCLLGTPLVVPAPGVLGNDRDAEGNALEAHLSQAPSRGTLTLARDGGFRFTPAAGQTGSTSFIYRCYDGKGFRTATATITMSDGSEPDSDRDGIVDRLDSCPSSRAQTQVTINGCETGVPDVRDANGCFLSERITSLTQGQPARWVFVNGVTQLVQAEVAAGRLTPAQAEAITTCAQSYDLPTAVPDRYTLTTGGVTVSAPGVLANDFDLEGDAMEAHLHQAPSTGNLTLARDGSFRYTPAAGQTGAVQFVYRCWDGSGYRTATVTLEP